MKAGLMQWQMTVQRHEQVGTDPQFNEPIYDWVTIATVWAQKIAKSEDEKFAAEQEYATRIVTFRTYYIDGLLTTDQLIVDGLTYNIKGIRELGYRDGMDISAQWVS